MWQDGVLWISIVAAICGLLFICFALLIKRDMRGMSLNHWGRWYHGLFGAFLFMSSFSLIFLRLISIGKLAPLYFSVVIISSLVSMVFIFFAALALRQSWIQSS